MAYVFLLCLGFFIWQEINKGDELFFFAEKRNLFLNTFFSFATLLGEWHGYILVAVIFFILKKYEAILLIGLTGGAASLVANLLKNTFKHPRPKPYFRQFGQDISALTVKGHQLLESQTSSFPSGHTISAFAFFTVLAFFSKSHFLKIIFLILAIFSGVSRIYLVHHFLEDVLFGSLIGVLTGFFLFYEQKYISKMPYFFVKK